MDTPKTIDVHAHFLPPVYQDALRDAGLKMLDGGIPTPTWSPERALAIMDEVGISGAVLSVSSPHLNFVDAGARGHACAIDQRLRRRYQAPPSRPLRRVCHFAVARCRSEPRGTRAWLDQLGLDGVALPTHTAGHYLGDAALAPLLAALDARKATVFVHPTSPPCFEAFGLELPAPMIESPFDTTRTTVTCSTAAHLRVIARSTSSCRMPAARCRFWRRAWPRSDRSNR